MIQIEPNILEFIRTSEWRFAKTMPQWPHEYIVRVWRPDAEHVFEQLVMLIQNQGYDETFMDATYRYLDIDAWKYWTMGEEPRETTIINRAKV